MKWAVEMADEFEPEFDALDKDIQTEILARYRSFLRNLVPNWDGLVLTRSTALATRI